MNKMIIGIDPGLTGAIAVVDAEQRTLVHVVDMPIFTVRGRRMINPPALVSILDVAPDAHVWFEDVAARPGQGVVSMHRFGWACGATWATVMIAGGRGHPLHEITPRKWKAHFGLTDNKDDSRSLAIKRFPASAGHFARKKDDGRAEAALLALYGSERG